MYSFACRRTVLAESFGAEAAHVSAPTTTRDTFTTETRYTITLPTQQSAGASGAPAGVRSVAVTARAQLPSSLSLHMDLGGGRAIQAFVNTVPISETRAVNRWVGAIGVYEVFVSMYFCCAVDAHAYTLQPRHWRHLLTSSAVAAWV